jgi:DNA invertase Pin-like site-specific DNA recombinase
VRLAAYLRVSTDRQADEGLGLDVQEQGIARWAKKNGHQVVAWHRDEGISGSNGIDTRRGLLDVLTALEDGTVGGIVTYRLDRLARNLTIQEGTLSKVWALGGTVFAVDIGEIPQDDPDDPMRTALRQMVGVFAQLERGMIGARLRAARRLKAERGGYAYGAPPFGYRALAGALVPDDAEQATIARARALRTQGLSLRNIATTLDTENRGPRRAERWHPSTVASLL